MTGFLDFLEDQGGEWIIWTPELAAKEPEIVDAVRAFNSLDIPAGRAASNWLKESSLDNHPSTVTQLLLKDGRVEAFFALCSGQAKLSQRHRKKLLRRGVGLYPGRRLHELHPLQPVALIAWLAKASDSDFPGDEILLQASAAAIEVVEISGQGQIGIALDPFDDETADFWKKRYRFRTSQELDGRSCLWRTIMPDPAATK
jgi:hypothetical protein